MKRLFALFLAFTLLLPVFSYAEPDEEDFSSDEITEELDLDEDYSFDEEGNLILQDEETGEISGGGFVGV